MIINQCLTLGHLLEAKRPLDKQAVWELGLGHEIAMTFSITLEVRNRLQMYPLFGNSVVILVKPVSVHFFPFTCGMMDKHLPGPKKAF